jgi:hypothetical protein
LLTPLPLASARGKFCSSFILDVATRNLSAEPVKTFEYYNSHYNITCTVCLNDFEENEEVKQLPCKHYFHTECIEKWLQQKDACPLCNAGIDTTSSKSKSTTAAADVAAQ